MILHSKTRVFGGRNPESKISCDGGGSIGRGGGGGFTVNRKESTTRKLYDCSFCFYIFPDGTMEIAKNRLNALTGKVNVNEAVPILARTIAELKLKDTGSKIFKEGLSKLLQESIEKTLEGDYYERAICSKSAGDGS